MRRRLENPLDRRLGASDQKGSLLLCLSTGVASIAISGASVAVWAASSGRVSGTLRDPQGQAVAGATIDLARQGNATWREAKTDESGQYSFDALPAGEYSLTAEFTGFEPIAHTTMRS